MARTSRRAAKKKSVSLDFSQVGKQFEAGMEYAIEVKSCTLEDGNEYPYFAFQFKGVDEGYENSIMYHNASTSPQSLWRLRPLLEALGMEIPEGPLELEPEEFIGMQCMCSTISEKKPGGGSSIRPDEFWPLEDGAADDGKKSKGDDDEFDLDELSDADIKKLAKEFDIAGRDVEKLRKELGKADEDELKEACADLDIELGGKGGKASSRRRGAKSKDADEDEGESSGRSSRGSSKSSGKRGKKASVTEDEVQDMSEEELEDLIEQHDLDVDLDEHKTLRKKRVAVIDALTEAGIIEE